MAEHASTPAPGALHGEALHAFIDQAHELATGDEESGASAAIGPQERLAAAAELMGQQSFAPANVIELERVHDLWLLLDRPETANAFLQRHRATAVQAGDRPGAEIEARLALSDIQSRLGFDRDSALPLLLPTARLIAQLPAEVDPAGYWHGWESLTGAAQAWEAAEQGVDLRRTQERADPDQAGEQAFGDAMACLRKAAIARRRADETAVGAQVQAALNLLRDAGADQDVGFEHWMLAAGQLLPLAPQSLPALLMACEQQLARTEDPAPAQAVRTHRKVRIARLQAQACAQAGQFEAALQLAPQGHFGLTDDSGDEFGALLLQWLRQAGRLDQAAPLALQSALHGRPGSAVQAYHLALEQVNRDQDQAPIWALILAWAQIDEDFRHLLADEPPPPLNADWYLDMARTQSPNHPMIALAEGMRLARQRRHQEALPLLEYSVGQHPEIADSDKLPALWAARFAALPLAEALARPFPEAHGAHWCYAAGVILDDEDDLAPLMGERQPVPAEEVREPLVVRYYEEGLARFERFWATGQGTYKDADLHVYSMLCNNLAIKYRYMDRWDEAAELHRKGLASSPFAEHVEGLWWCANGRDDDAGIVAEAERLWHFAQDHGYGRHDPPNYFPTVALSLYKLDRGDEIGIWLERLDEWFASLDEDEQRGERRDYLAALMSLLDFFSAFRPEQVLPRLRVYQDEVRALRDCYVLRRLACALEAYPELLDECLALHKEAASYLNESDGEDERRMSREGIARAERKLAEHRAAASAPAAGGKPWWKFW